MGVWQMRPNPQADQTPLNPSPLKPTWSWDNSLNIAVHQSQREPLLVLVETL